MSKYIEFEFINKTASGKTEIYAVNSISGKERADDGYLLGIIKWYGPWRQYCFFPHPGCVFSRGCMDDINEFIKNLIEERKNHGSLSKSDVPPKRRFGRNKIDRT